tara:strand:- start:553 stop:1521 length:969 start_codon:yes stop_codon:yes gene_type:complete
MTYREALDTLLDYGGQASGSDFEQMAGRAINRYYRKILGAVNQDNQTREVTLTTVASRQDYGLPLLGKRVLSITDGANRRSLREISRGDYASLYPGTTASGSPRRYANIGRRGVEAQPSSASVISVSSSASTDGSGRYLRVKGLDANNVEIDEQLTLNGTTTVAGSTSFSSVETLSKSVDTGKTITGVLTVTSNSAAVTNARIPFFTTSPQYTWLRFYPIPDGALALTVQVVARKEPLVRDDDWPEFDEDFHHLLITGPGSEVLASVGKNAIAGKMWQEYEDNLRDFKGVQNSRPNMVGSFADVTTRQIQPDRPLIAGIDFI